MTPDEEAPWARAPAARLARLGFADTAGTARTLAALGLPTTAAQDVHDPAGAMVVEALAAAADPDLAVRSLRRLADAEGADLLQRLRTHAGLRGRLLALLGASAALGEHLARHSADASLLDDDSLLTSRPSAYGLRRALLAAVAGGGAEGLRLAFRRQQLLLAARDLTGQLLLDDVAAELADLAAAALEGALAVAAGELGPGHAPVRLAILGLGKCGGHELNYASDVDVVFVAEAADGAEAAALRTATRLAETVMAICGQGGPDGAMFPVDAALRPEGRAGPLVRTLASHRAYYERWARTWEFQALLKARPVAGDIELGDRWCAEVAPLVWSAAGRDSFVADVQAMRRRVERSLPAAEADRQLKLGPGGLRDVEFAVQLLQMVHGRVDETLRSGSTLLALQALRDGGYVGRADAHQLAESYRWLRLVEHRLQLQRLRRTHTVPRDPSGARWLARAVGYRGAADFDADRVRRAADVRRLHGKLFYRPLLDAVARLPADGARLTEAGARDRLTALGFADPEGALRHIAALSGGLSRRAAIQRTLLPVMVGAFADSADPDGGLLAFRQVSDLLGETPWYLRLLRDEGATAERLARLLATSRYAADLLGRAPEAMRLLADDEALVPRSRASIETALAAVVDRAPAWEQAVAAARGVRRLELLRVASADLLGRLDSSAVGAALSDAAGATIAAALRIATAKVEAELRGPLPIVLAVVALGRLGGGEVGYGSDADVVFVHEPLPAVADHEASTAAHAVAYETRRLLALPAPDPPLLLDAGLRPEGRQGPLARSLAAYRAYHGRWASVWEAQALLRAAPLAGDPDVARRFIEQVADPARYPTAFTADQVREVRRLKARMEAERVSPAQRARNLKLGPGGLSDVEWTVQLLQLRHAHELPGLRVTGTLPALLAAVVGGLVAPADADVLSRAWLGASRARNAVTLVTGRAADLLPPTGSRELAGVARLLGYPPEAPVQLVEDLRRQGRRARAVVDRLFYGEPG